MTGTKVRPPTRKRFTNPIPVHDDTGFTITTDPWEVIDPDRAASLRVRAQMMRQINARIDGQGWLQREAAVELGLAQPRISELRQQKIDKFSLDALVAIGDKLGVSLTVVVD